MRLRFEPLEPLLDAVGDLIVVFSPVLGSMMNWVVVLSWVLTLGALIDEPCFKFVLSLAVARVQSVTIKQVAAAAMMLDFMAFLTVSGVLSRAWQWSTPDEQLTSQLPKRENVIDVTGSIQVSWFRFAYNVRFACPPSTKLSVYKGLM